MNISQILPPNMKNTKPLFNYDENTIQLVDYLNRTTMHSNEYMTKPLQYSANTMLLCSNK